jgi:hypothetical protein
LQRLPERAVGYEPQGCLPEAFDGSSLSVDGETVETIAAEGLANRRYLWLPSLKAVFGGVMIFSGVHVWTADTPTAEMKPTGSRTWTRSLPATQRS